MHKMQYQSGNRHNSKRNISQIRLYFLFKYHKFKHCRFLKTFLQPIVTMLYKLSLEKSYVIPSWEWQMLQHLSGFTSVLKPKCSLITFRRHLSDEVQYVFISDLIDVCVMSFLFTVKNGFCTAFRPSPRPISCM